MKTLLGVCAAAILLAGCESPYLRDVFPPYTERDILARGWATPAGQTQQETYCYETLAKPDCYRMPVDGQGHRLTGAYAPTAF